MSRDDDTLFSRWSRRKRAVAEEKNESAAPSVEVEPAASAEVDEAEIEESEEEALARFGLPSPESLGPGDDFSGFMQSGVPEYLRRRALRRLWRSNPVLANLDGLNDYDEDFTSPEETAKILNSAYKIGRGFLKDPDEEVVEENPETDQEVEPTETADAGTGKPDDSDRNAEQATDVAVADKKQSEATTTEPSHKPETPQASRPKRMRFKA